MPELEDATSLEVKLIPISMVEFSFSGADQGIISGYASTFNGVDSYGDTIAPGAYAKTIQQIKERGYPLQIVDNHYGPVIGKWTSLEENARGLKVTGEFTPGHSGAADVLANVKHGAVSGLSIGYRVRDWDPKKPAGRLLKDIDLREISVVDNPADSRARIGSVKSADIDAIKTLSDAENFLREAGGPRWSKSTARDLVSCICKIARREAVGDPDLKGLLDQIRSTRSRITTAR